MKKIKLAVVGYGRRGGHMFETAVNAFQQIEVVAVCDKSPKLLQRAKKDWPGIVLHENFDTMLDAEKIDALLVETPATNHANFCVKALNKNIHVMSDIPCVGNKEEAWDLWAAEQKSGAIFMAGANPNMWAFVDTAIDLKEKGMLGKPYYIEAEYIHDIRDHFEKTPWREKYESIRYCTHSLGPMLKLIDEDLEWVTCFDTGSHIDKIDGRHDAMAALFRTKSHVVVRLLVTFINNRPSSFHSYKVYGTKGYFERTPPYPAFSGAEKNQRTYFSSTENSDSNDLVELFVGEKRSEHAANKHAIGHGGADYALLERFVAAIDKTLPSPIPLKEGLRMSLPGIYAAESARKGGELTKIEYPWN